MKKLVLILALFCPLFLVAQRTSVFRQPLPDISANGVIRQPKSRPIEISGFTNPEKKVFFLMRHAEKDSVGELSEAGRERARMLAFMFANIPFEAIYTTRVSRVVGTVKPTAQSQKLPVGFYEAKTQSEWVRTLFEQPQRIFMIGGHSNTIPKLVNTLTGKTSEADLADDNYNTLFIVVASQPGNGQLYKITY